MSEVPLYGSLVGPYAIAYRRVLWGAQTRLRTRLREGPAVARATHDHVHRITVVFSGDQGIRHVRSSYLLIVDVTCVKSRRLSYMGKYPQNLVFSEKSARAVGRCERRHLL